ncbi:MAG: hypothetical protein ACRDD1_12475, partial [Planctomycetia bacterium]
SPNTYRIEGSRRSVDDVDGDYAENVLLVRDGDGWTSRDAVGKVATSREIERVELAGLLSHTERHFDQARIRVFIEKLSLEAAGFVKTAGRDCLRLRAVPRDGALLWPQWLPYGADEYEFHADVERGCLLYVGGLRDGALFDFSEVLQVSYDEPIDDERFTFTPLPGDQTGPAIPIVERTTLSAAAARVSFRVLLPSRRPYANVGDYEAWFLAPRPRDPRTMLQLMIRGEVAFRGDAKYLWIVESDLPDPEAVEFEWEHVERNGTPMAISDPGADAGLRLIALERHGTHVVLQSDLDRETLIDVAASFVDATDVLMKS